jgi:hypothetical protein
MLTQIKDFDCGLVPRLYHNGRYLHDKKKIQAKRIRYMVFVVGMVFLLYELSCRYNNIPLVGTISKYAGFYSYIPVVL